MKRYTWQKIFVLFILLMIPVGVSALPLGSVTIGWSSGDYSGGATGAVFYTSLTDYNIEHGAEQVAGVGGWFPSISFDPFFIRNITTNDIGSTFAINGSNYAYWDNMVQYILTDGTQDLCAYDLGSSDTPGQPLDWKFSQDYAGNGTDFQGYAINGLLLTIDDFQLAGANNYGYKWIATWTLTVDGQPVPEPATLLLFGAGVLGFAGLRKKLQR